MPIYRLIPVASADDDNWQLAFNQGEVVVRARSSGLARAMAAIEEAAQYMSGEPKITTQVEASAFRQANLYTVVRDTSGEFEEDGPDKVLRGTFSFPENMVARKGD